MRQLHERIFAWFDHFGRKDLPWQRPRTPYRVWISEIMLQQTQVETAIPYFERFMERFPTVEALASAPIESVLEVWQGLGYYRRAHNLHKAAQIIARQGGFPETVEGWQKLPGVGRSTAGAIVSLAFDKPAPMLDGNVKRLWCRLFAIEGWPELPEIEKRLWQISEEMLPKARAADWTQALMDLGALICRPKGPLCHRCPLREASEGSTPTEVGAVRQNTPTLVGETCRAFREGRIGQLPAPRPKVEKPEKEVFWLILRNGRGEIYLEKRPNYGLWSGLWALPEFRDEREALESLRTAPQSVERFPEGKHTFTHFRLRFHPLLAEVAGGFQVRESEGGWFPLDRLPPLPKPVQRLLRKLGQKRREKQLEIGYGSESEVCQTRHRGGRAR